MLPPSHPLRQSFTRYARWIAVHVQFTFPASIVLAFLLTYPMFFLYTTDTTAVTNGASNLPHHVWTDARSLEGYASPEPDVIMRSVWVHGNYMGALHRDVLLGALELQNELLGPTENFSPRQTGRPEATKPPLRDLRLEERDGFHITNGLTNQSWFFHSPLKYWSCSAANIRADPDLLATVNTKKTLSTTVNVTLRHSIVFSGKRFEERRLVAADALVITLLHLRDSPVAEQWVRKTESLARESKTKWVVIPADGKTNASQLYEFQFRPISRLDSFFLAVAYVLAALYVTAGLSRFHAVKSKTSLMAAILLQMASSIASSFTVCAVFKLDVSRVPYYAYPLVMLAISMENSLRLVNAVIMNSSVVNTNDRIGEAFGETAHIAMAHRFGNLALLLLLSWVTYPGVAAFCTFAAIATVFDFVYLSTLFLLVLKLDVRQRELSDMVKAIGPQAQTAAHRSRGTATGPRTLADLFSLTPTHVAGTAVLLAVVLVADYHAIGCHHVGKLSRHRPLGDGQASSTSSLAQIHQARSPPSWLRLQDHETAREVIHAIKPWAHSYVARVYDPVVFVLRGSDRTPPTAEPVLLPAVYDFVHHQIPRYLALAGLLFWLLHLLTSYLARDEEAMVAWHQNHPYGESLLTVKSLAGCHTLDVLMLASAHQDRLVSVGLDRVVGVWDLRLGLQAKVKTKPGHAPNPFPLLAIALDADSKWLAFLSPHELLMWNVAQQRWGPSVDLEVGGTNPEAFFFVDRAGESAEAVVIVKRDGIMLEVEPATGEVEETVVCKTPLIWAGGFAVQQGKDLEPWRHALLSVRGRHAPLSRDWLTLGSVQLSPATAPHERASSPSPARDASTS